MQQPHVNLGKALCHCILFPNKTQKSLRSALLFTRFTRDRLHFISEWKRKYILQSLIIVVSLENRVLLFRVDGSSYDTKLTIYCRWGIFDRNQMTSVAVVNINFIRNIGTNILVKIVNYPLLYWLMRSSNFRRNFAENDDEIVNLVCTLYMLDCH